MDAATSGTGREGLLPGRAAGAPIIVVGLGYGDESKGATVDYLASQIPDTAAVVRWSGGAQAAHNVWHGPRHHTFRQFGSASLLDVRTILRAPMMVNPLNLAAEAGELEALGIGDPLGLITADARALVTTPIHVAMNRAREILRGNARHGSTGEGIGETAAYALAVAGQARAGSMIGNFRVLVDAPARPAPTLSTLRDRAATIRALDALAGYAAPLLASAGEGASHESVETIADALCSIAEQIRITDDVDTEIAAVMATGTVLFEGSQGVLLDEWNGFHPYTTWSTVVPTDLIEWVSRTGHNPYVLGLTRCYATRHGAGPMPTEDANLQLPDVHNREGRYQGAWRTGHLDLPALRYAAAITGQIDGVAVSHLDVLETADLQVAETWNGDAEPLAPLRTEDTAALEDLTALACEARPDYRPLPVGVDAVTELIAGATGAPVVLTAAGPTRTDRSIIVQRPALRA
ncbi:adenylosuccinate synthetase [Williamsia sp. 1135]|uniref:adenylosuccinate synthetase n=1 Tax=Williamsia sp. 1135 TaxID=1889262 RepID=UPI000A11C119|nr:adenylosuccinate synthetase [Williamsia sp. 1135]ORM33379.1 adenylosuccinate synthetase [Williamsia sp. 1135]